MEQFLNLEVWNGKRIGDVLTPEFLGELLGGVMAAFVILIIGFIFSGWVGRRIRKLGLAYESLDDTLFGFLGTIARYAIMTMIIVLVLNNFGIQTASLVAVIGAAGLAIGLALQGTLSNVAAGVMIILFRPIKMGDFVTVNGRSGTVKDISLNYTELASVGNTQIIIPNSEVWGNTIENYSHYPQRRAEWEFSVGYGADLDAAERVILRTIMDDPRSLSTPDPFIQVNSLNASSVDFLVRVWCDASVYFQYQADMKRRVKEALDGAGVEIPFPTRTVLMQSAQAD